MVSAGGGSDTWYRSHARPQTEGVPYPVNVIGPLMIAGSAAVTGGFPASLDPS